MGPFATMNCESRQVRKEAAVTIISSAEMWLINYRLLIIAKN